MWFVIFVKILVRVVHPKFQSNVYANSYRRGWNYILLFVIYYDNFPIVFYRSCRIQLIVNSPHHVVFLILLQNAFRDMVNVYAFVSVNKHST